MCNITTPTQQLHRGTSRQWIHRRGTHQPTILLGCIADSGTTTTCGTPAHAKHFEDTGEVSNKTFIVANGTTEEATEIKKLPYTQLREEARQIHMVPGITTSTLLSTGTNWQMQTTFPSLMRKK